MGEKSTPRNKSRDTPADGVQLPANLRRIRLEAGLTLDQLAERADVSRAMISKIERGVSVPTATVLGKLAAGLRIGLSQLLGTSQSRKPKLIKRKAQSVFRDPETGFERRSMSPLFADGAVDIAFNELPPGRSAAFPPHHEGVEEYLFVHEGKLSVLVDGTRYSVAAGDTLFYPSNCKHEFCNDGADIARFYVVVDDRSKR